MSEFVNGKYRAKPFNWGMRETKAGNPMAFIEFSTDSGNVTWFGTFGEGFARENTVKTLVTCGFRDEDLVYLAEEDALDRNTEVSIVVSMDTYEGKTSPKVNWVNPIRTGLAKSDIKKVSKGIDLRALFKEEFKEIGAKRRDRTVDVQSADISAEDIPF